MTDPSSTGLVHQAFFGWSYQSPKLTLVACSSTKRSEQERWHAWLKEHIRLEGVPSQEKQYTALSYLDFDNGMAAVLHRVTQGFTEARNNSHALIGPASVLTPALALGLEHWSSWSRDRPTNNWMGTINPSYFANYSDDTAQRMRPLAASAHRQIQPVLSVLLEHPQANLSVIGCPREERLPMLWALRGAADVHLRRMNVRRRWTFSTHEVRHEDAVKYSPEIIFLPSRAVDVGYSSRVIIDMTRELASHRNDKQAHELLAHLLSESGQAAPDPVYESVSAGVTTAASGQSSPDLPDTSSWSPEPSTSVVPSPGARDNGQDPNIPRYVDSLRNATTGQEVIDALRSLAACATQPQQRTALRQQLDVDLVNRATKIVMETAAEQVASRLMKAAYGPECADLQNSSAPMAYVTQVITDIETDDVARRLSSKAYRWGERQVERAAYLRWEEGRGHAMPPASARGIASAGTPRKRRAKERQSWKVNAIAAGGVLAFVGLIFLLGVLVGSPSTEQDPRSEMDTPTTSAAEPTDPNKPPPVNSQWASLPRYGKVTVRPGNDEVVYSFVQVGQMYYPQGQCTTVDGIDTWQCSRMPASPANNVIDPVLVAFVVPESETDSLQRHAAEGGSIPAGPGWGEQKPIQK